MADATITLNPGQGGPFLDTEEIGGGVHRERILIAGHTLAAVAGVANTPPGPSAYGLAVRAIDAGGALQNGAQTAVSSSAVQVLAANASRRKAVIQNVGLNPVRIGTTGVTATSGLRLAAGDVITFRNPDCPTNAIFAIRDGLLDSTVLAQEVV